MKKFMICLLILGMAGIIYATPSILSTCINPTNGNTYNLLSASTWTEAEAFAVSTGTHLVSINDAAENNWVFQTFCQNRNLWIGLNADATGWHWTDGSPVTYTNFWDLSHGYPAEPYIVMGTGYAGRWDDWANITPWPCNGNPIFGVTESVPEPATLALLTLGGMVFRKRK